LECINLTSKPRTVQFLTDIIDSREFARDNGEEKIEINEAKALPLSIN
jgi:hypothetical protein